MEFETLLRQLPGLEQLLRKHGHRDIYDYAREMYHGVRDMTDLARERQQEFL
jgi:hypothetical protein